MAKFDCCVKCSDRKAGCHGSCEAYLADRAKNLEEKERERQIKDAERDYVGFKAAKTEAIRRRLR